MVKKFIYETVLKSYWVPITILTILVTFIMIAAVTLFLHIIAIMPIKEMSQTTEFILNQEKYS